MLGIGDALPDVTLDDQDGEKVSIASLHGHPFVLFAYPKAGTGGCTKQACGFRDQRAAFDARGMRILGISPDLPAKLKAWQEKEQLGFDLLSDPDRLLLDPLGAWGEKSMYGRKYMGVIRSHWVIDERGVIVDAQVKVSPAKSIEKAVRYARGT